MSAQSFLSDSESAPPSASDGRKLRILAIASGGGHWVQLLRLWPAYAAHNVLFISTLDYASRVPGRRFRVVRDANRSDKVALVLLAISLLGIIARERPDVVISTGAAPGYLALRLGRYFGARTIWIDSFANAEELSLSGKLVRSHADLWLTQWEHLAKPEGPVYAGSIL